MGQRCAQVCLEPGAGRDHSLHVGVEKAQRVAPGGLGLVHGQVGLLEQFAHAGLVAGERRHANAGRAAVLVALQRIGHG